MKQSFNAIRLLATISVLAFTQSAGAEQPFQFLGAPCATPPVLHCPDKDCTPDRVINPGLVVEMKTRRTYFLDYPCDLKPGEKVTFILSLHGGGSYGNWQRHYFPIMDYADKSRLVIARKRTKGQTTGGAGNSTSPLVACPATPPLRLRKAMKNSPPTKVVWSAATFPLRARMHARTTSIHLTQGSARPFRSTWAPPVRAAASPSPPPTIRRNTTPSSSSTPRACSSTATSAASCWTCITRAISAAPPTKRSAAPPATTPPPRACTSSACCATWMPPASASAISGSRSMP